MTYDPSMTITSTIPAPEGSDSTSREGKAIPLPVMAGVPVCPYLSLLNIYDYFCGIRYGKDRWRYDL